MLGDAHIKHINRNLIINGGLTEVPNSGMTIAHFISIHYSVGGSGPLGTTYWARKLLEGPAQPSSRRRVPSVHLSALGSGFSTADPLVRKWDHRNMKKVLRVRQPTRQQQQQQQQDSPETVSRLLHPCRPCCRRRSGVLQEDQEHSTARQLMWWAI